MIIAMLLLMYAVFYAWLIMFSLYWLMVPLGFIAIISFLLLFNSDSRTKNTDHLESRKHHFSSHEHYSAEEKILHRKHRRNMFYIIFIGAIVFLISLYCSYHVEKAEAQKQYQENKMHAVMSAKGDLR